MIIFVLSIYLIVVIFLLAVLLKSINNSETLKYTILLFASIVPALPYVFSTMVPEQNEKIACSIFTDTEIKNIQYPNPWFYWKYVDEFNFYSGTEKFIKFDGTDHFLEKSGMDIIEEAILSKLCSFNMRSWDSTYEYLESASSTSFNPRPSDYKTKSSTISNDELKKIFRHNALIKNLGTFPSFGLFLPYNSKIDSKPIPHTNTRIITIQNKDVVLKITIQPVGYSRNYFDEIKLHKNFYDDFYDKDENSQTKSKPPCVSFDYFVTINTNFHWPISSIDREKYLIWNNNVVNVLKELDWATIESEYKKFISEEATFKILKTK